MLRTCIEKKKKRKKKKKKKKKDLVATGFEPRTPTCESNVTTTAQEHYVFKNESSFYVIAYSSWLNSNQKPAERLLPSKDFKNRKYIFFMVAQPIFDLTSIDFTPK